MYDDRSSSSNKGASEGMSQPGSNPEDIVGQRDGQTKLAQRSQHQTFLQQALSVENEVTMCETSSDSYRRTQFTASSFTILATSILAGGVLLGVALPKNQNLPSRSWQVLSSIIGYTYFLAWSASFYPQIFLNHERRTTHGLSVDFCVLNVLGYVCYTIYTVNFYWNRWIIDEYKSRMSATSNGEDEAIKSAKITVQGNDVAFAIHALIMSSFTLSQIGLYDSFAIRPPSQRVYTILSSVFILCTIYIGATWMLVGHVDFLGFLYVLGSIKIGVTIGKYVPQALLNQTRKSTEGWNVWNVILDLTGGILSFLQLIGDCADTKDWSGVTGNPAKIALALVTICFDVIFLVQHYILYPGADEKHSYSILPLN